LAKNVVVTVDDYLMRKDPKKYEKILELKEKKETVARVEEESTEKRELLDEIQELTERAEAAESTFKTQVEIIKELKSRIKELEGKNFELQMRLKKTGKKK